MSLSLTSPSHKIPTLWDFFYKSDELLAVPQYSDLLEDQYHEDERERGRVLVSSASGWRIEMAKWIAEAREAELEESDDDGEREDVMDD